MYNGTYMIISRVPHSGGDDREDSKDNALG